MGITFLKNTIIYFFLTFLILFIMKDLKFFVGALLMGAMVFTGCNKKGGPNVIEPNKPDTPEIEKEEAPSLAAPGAGKITIAVRVPDGTCNGIVAVGTNGTEELSWDPAGTDFTPVEGKKSWYQVTLTYAADMIVKVVAKAEDGTVGWETQWGTNTEAKENVTLVGADNKVTIDNSENGGEVKLVSFSADNTVIYVDVDAWKSAPCAERNKAGKATFTMTAPKLPEGAVVGIVGSSFVVEGDTLTWKIEKPVEMAIADGKWTVTVDVTDKCEYKYFYKLSDGIWSWENGEDGENRQMALDLKPVDEVKAWKGLPAE